MSQIIIVATNNSHKLNEIKNILTEGITLKSLQELHFKGNLKEEGKTLETNAYQKAKQVWDIYHLPCFADDSGLEINSLNGEPGVYSARYAGQSANSQRNIDLVLYKLKNQIKREAIFKTVIVYIDAKGLSHEFEGEIKGLITLEPRGLNGFGYDPIFQPETFKQTFAEMDDKLKNKISHRSRALKKFSLFFQNQGNRL